MPKAKCFQFICKKKMELTPLDYNSPTLIHSPSQFKNKMISKHTAIDYCATKLKHSNQAINSPPRLSRFYYRKPSLKGEKEKVKFTFKTIRLQGSSSHRILSPTYETPRPSQPPVISLDSNESDNKDIKALTIKSISKRPNETYSPRPMPPS